MEYSTRKDLVVWHPPPRYEFILDTRTTYNDYVNTLKRILNFDSKFDYDYFMAELGEVVMSIICRSHDSADNLRATMGHHRAMLPSDLDTDGLTMMQLRFQALVNDAIHKVSAMRLYDQKGYLPFHFKGWHVGCLLIEHINFGEREL